MKPKYLPFLFLILSLLFLPSCGDGNTSIVGSWNMTKCVIDGEKLSDINPCVFTFREDMTGEKRVLGEVEFTFSYSYEDGSCILFNLVYPDGETDPGTFGDVTVKGNKMYVHAFEDGMEEDVTFKRIRD